MSEGNWEECMCVVPRAMPLYDYAVGAGTIVCVLRPKCVVLLLWQIAGSACQDRVFIR